MDYKKVFETMVDETAKYLSDHRLKSMVLGLSGGIDSTVTAAVCHEVVKRHPELKFIGVSMPCTTNTVEENDSASKAMRAFCTEYWVENLQAQYLLMKATCEQHYESTALSQGNIKARLRMIYLYNLASVTGGMVMDTDNLTEHNLGFWTIHGDVADFNPIGGLWKHEVYELCKYLYTEVFTDADDVRHAFDDYGVDACMVGRATFGQPWIFREMRGGKPLSTDEKMDILKEQIRQSIARIGERRGILHIRRHLAATPLFKGIPNFRDLRIVMLRAETEADLFQMLDRIRPLVVEGRIE